MTTKQIFALISAVLAAYSLGLSTAVLIFLRNLSDERKDRKDKGGSGNSQ